MSIVTRALLYLSKTDRQLVLLCSDVAYKTQVGYGVFVLIVGIFAFVSASYALHTALGDSGFVYLIAMVYSALIMFIDREIVSATGKNKRMLATRLTLAVFIGLVISVPLELRIFEPQLRQELKIIQNQNNSPYLTKKEQGETQYRDRILGLEQHLHNLETEESALQNRLTNEVLQPDRQITGITAGTGRPGEGPVFRRLKAQIEEKDGEVSRARDELGKLKADESAELARIAGDYHAQEIPLPDDLLSRYVALGAVKRDPDRGWDAWSMAWGLRLLLIMLELTPALIKVLQQDSEYDALLRANRRRSITRIYAIANDHMEQLTQNGGQNPTPTLVGQLKADPLTS
jgi:hypothetical protein